MASNKAKLRNVKVKAAPGLGKAGAKALGEKLEQKQIRDYEKREAEREAGKENVRRIMENSVEAEYDSGENISER